MQKGSSVEAQSGCYLEANLKLTLWCDKHWEMIEAQEDEKRKQIIAVFSRYHLNTKE